VEYWEAGTTNYYLLPLAVTDAVGNTTTVNAYNWYNLQPTQITDINENESHILYDALGLPTAMAMMEKDGSVAGDTLAGIDVTDEESLISDFFADPLANAGDVLQGATWRCVYDFAPPPVDLVPQPSVVAMIARCRHYSDEPAPGDAGMMMRLTYTDGLGRVVMHKALASTAEGDTTPRWIGTGKTVYNNKGNAVMQYEPYFSDTAAFDSAAQAAAASVTSVIYYDPLGRVLRTDLPDGSYTRTVWTPWLQQVWDNNDTVADSDWRTAALAGDDGEEDAATKTDEHAGTPTTMHLDTLARPCCTVQQNRHIDTGTWVTDDPYISHVALDIQGNRLAITDARELTAQTYTYNMLQAVALQTSMDSGTHCLLADAAGQPLYSWDADERLFHFTYDVLRRLLKKDVTPSGGSENVLERIEYGEGVTDDTVYNLRGMPYIIYDGAGKQTFSGYDFKGLPLQVIRKFVRTYTSHPDWASPGAVAMDSDNFFTTTTYDALGRPVSITTPDGAITTHTYDQGGMLYSVAVEDAGGTLTTDIINEIYYNARGQRIKIKYENGATTTYTYDANTFRVSRIRTTRSTDSAVLQDLNYWYDPVGNITRQTDDAQQDVYYDNPVAEPTNDYTYDALYRLIKCEGREHAGSNAAVSCNDSTRCGLAPLPTDASAMRRYIQYYKYDEVGNVLQMKHTTSGGTGNWTRDFTPDSTSNKLSDSSIGSDATGTESYNYDARGNIADGMNHLLAMDYNHANRLEKLEVTVTITTYYQYDSNGQRVRKVTENTGAALRYERRYIAGWEVYRETDTGTSTITLERETLHVMDDTARVAIIDTPTIDTLSSDEVQTLRYQFSNHLGTATLELDDAADDISYEEYYPYGNTSYQAGRSAAEVSLKRYRYIGNEHDDESGLYYIGARYYCPWLARWLEPDPINNEWYNLSHGNPGRNMERQFVELTASSYEYCYANPIRFTDPSGEQVPPRERESESFTKNMAEGAARGAQDNLAPQAKPLTKPRQEPDILKADVFGGGHIGTSSEVNANVWGVNAAHDDMVGGSAQNGLFGALGFRFGGEKWAIGLAHLDNVLLGLHFQRAESSKGMKFVSDPLSPKIDRTEKPVHSIGKWVPENVKGWSNRAVTFQEHVTGVVAGKAFKIENTKFDGVRGRNLIEAKSGYDRFIDKNGDFHSWFSKGVDGIISQAERQLKAANGAPVEWHFSSPITLKATKKVFEENDIRGIILIYNIKP
jgi:RHS repeat-associated protein